MSLAIGNPRRKLPARAARFSPNGFTILEILMVLGLIAIITTLFVTNFNLVFQEEEEVTAENAFWVASREGRLQALLTKQPIILYYDDEEPAFVLTRERGGGEMRRFPVHALTSDGREIRISFVQERPSTELIMIRGRLINTRPIPQVVFYPDGTATSFWLEMEAGGERRQIRVDPWTGSEMLEQSHRPF